MYNKCSFKKNVTVKHWFMACTGFGDFWITQCTKKLLYFCFMPSQANAVYTSSIVSSLLTGYCSIQSICPLPTIVHALHSKMLLITPTNLMVIVHKGHACLDIQKHVQAYLLQCCWIHFCPKTFWSLPQNHGSFLNDRSSILLLLYTAQGMQYIYQCWTI